jgi:hypothetical protein
MDAGRGAALERESSVLPAAESDPGGKRFDEYVEAICEDFYAGEVGRPGLSLGIYFRPLLMVGYFEGIDSERGIAWRASHSPSTRSFVRIALDESVPDHSHGRVACRHAA